MQAVPGGAAALELQSPGTVGQDPPSSSSLLSGMAALALAGLGTAPQQ